MHLSCCIAVKLFIARGCTPAILDAIIGVAMTVIDEKISAVSRAHFCYHRGTFLLSNFDPTTYTLLDFSERIDRILRSPPCRRSKGERKEESAYAGSKSGVMIASGDDRRRWRTTFFRMPGSNWREKIRSATTISLAGCMFPRL